MKDMESSAWHLSLKLSDKPKAKFRFPDTEPGDVHPGGYQVSSLKQLISAQLSDSLPDPELIGQSWFSNIIDFLSAAVNHYVYFWNLKSDWIHSV